MQDKNCTKSHITIQNTGEITTSCRKSVYIVHCIDTEGPLNETLEATFERLKQIFGIELEPSEENLKLLQQSKIPLAGIEKAVANLVAPNRLAMNRSWHEIDSMLDKIQTESFRTALPDSCGNGWVYNWFCMDHVGFTGSNPRFRDLGYHKAYDYYRKRTDANPMDTIQWHYHPLPLSGNVNDCGTAYLNSSNIYEILGRNILERCWFPSSFRPGFHTERPDSNWFLEQWIPFDYANQATLSDPGDQPDLSGGRFGDWRVAPIMWQPYHPDIRDYQKPGNCRRWIARCLNMESRIRELKLTDVLQAFESANNNSSTLLSFTNHDFRDMTSEINKVRDYIKKAAEQYPNVDFFYCQAPDAFRRVIGISPKSCELKCWFEKDDNNSKVVLHVKTNDLCFGVQPFLALQTKDKKVLWENFDFQVEHYWTFTFDGNTMPFSELLKIGVASNSTSGVTDVFVYDVRTEATQKNIWLN